MRATHLDPIPLYVFRRFRQSALLLGTVLALLLAATAGAQTTAVFGPEDFERGRGKPITESREFSVATPGETFLVRIENGGSQGQFSLVSSAVVSISGQVVAGPSDFSKNVTLIEREVLLKETSLLEVELRGEPGSGFTLTVLGSGPGAPPELEPIGDQTVDVGSTLFLQLEATDPEGGEVFFSVSPLPLPDNASFDAEAGFFSFAPNKDQVENFELTFAASDGFSASSETVTVTVNPPVPGAPTAISGQLLDTNDFVNDIETPIVGATVSIDGSGVSVQTGLDGRFSLSGIPAGLRVIRLDSSSADPAPDGSTYADFAEAIDLIEGVDNNVARPFFLPRIAAESLTTIDPSVTTTVANPSLGVSVTVPPSTARNPNGTLFTGQMSISEVPAALAPVSLPEELGPGLLLTVQPAGVEFTTPVPLIFPNLDGFPAGSEADLWSVNPSTGLFEQVGTGRVSADGTVIETIAGGISVASWHSFLPPQPGGDGDDNNDDNQDDDRCDDCSAGSQTALLTGNLAVHHDLPAYFSLDRPRSLRLVYNSERAAPRPVIKNRVTISRRSAVPPRVSSSLEIGGAALGTQVVTDTSGLSESVDETIRQVVQFPAQVLPTGRYRYRTRLTSEFSRSSISSFQGGRAVVYNLSDSPLGAGWGLARLQRVHPQDDGSILITDGDGSAQVFTPAPLDLRDWTQEGPLGNGNWSVAADGQSVFQSINGNPTFFVSPESLIDTVVRGSFRVETTSDDDFVGFVIGYQSPLRENGDDPNQFDFLLFDWKQRQQTFSGVTGAEGFHLARYSGSITSFFPPFWGHVESSQVQVLARDLGPGKGWTPFTDLDFELIYERDRIRISINGDQIFDVAGTFEPGRFGFYNFSQASVRYRSFTSSSRFESPAGDFSRVFRNDDGSFTRTFQDGTVFRYDAAGMQTTAIDPNGNVTTYAYDADGRLSSVTDPAGLATNLVYSNGRLAAITDPGGRTTNFGHDENGNLTRITDVDGTVREFDYDGHLLNLQRAKRGFEVRYGYDFAGRNNFVQRTDGSSRRLVAQNGVGQADPANAGTLQPVVRPEEARARYFDGNGNETIFETDRFGGAVRTITASGRVATAERDENGNPTRVVNSNGLVQEFSYDQNGNLIALRQSGAGQPTQAVSFEYDLAINQVNKLTDVDGNELTLEYDAAGNPTRIVDPLGNSTRAAYDARGLLTSATDQNGNTTTYEYDAAGNRVRITDAGGSSTRIERDALGRVTAIVEAEGRPEERTTRYAYDASNRLTETVLPDGAVVSTVYDAAGNPIESRLPSGEVTRRTYDERNRLVAIEDPIRGTTSLEYDANGNVTSFTDANGNVNRFAYDADNRMTQVIDALGNVQTLEYDGRGQLTRFENGAGQAWTFTYDPLDRLVAQTDPLGNTARRTYDSRNYLRTYTDPNGQTWTWTFDVLGRLVEQATPDNTIRRTYDPAGNLVSITDDDSELRFAYDALNRPVQTEVVDVGIQPGVVLDSTFNALGQRTSLTDSLGGTTGYAWDSNDRLTRLTTPAGPAIDLAYDLSGRPELVDLPNGLDVDYGYDANGRLSSLEYLDNVGSALNSFSYLYDALGNLLSIVEGARVREYSYDALERLISGGTAGLPETYEYDAVGNRVTSFLSNLHTYDAANRLLEDETFLYAYDLNGNLLSKQEKATGALTAYAYNTQNELVRIDRPDSSVVTYRYDAFGRRIEKNVAGTITRYVYDRLEILLEFDGTNALAARYSHGPNVDQPLAMERDGELYYYLADHQGTVRFLTDASGAQVNNYEYDSYGRLLVRNEGVANPFTYTGREYDEESGLYFFRSRYYDPLSGRFLRQDPLQLSSGTSNFYAYAGNNPVNNNDPLGLFTPWDALDVVSAALSLAEFIECPTLENAAWLGLDLIGLLPVVPGVGTARRGIDALDAANDALRGANRAQDAVNAGRRGADAADSAGDVGRRLDADCFCLSEETEILTEDGARPIAELHVGDRVIARDDETGETGLREVIGVFERDVKEMLIVDLDGEPLEVTPRHPLWLDGQGWIEAGEAKVGDRLVSADGSLRTITAIERLEGAFTVYNVEIEGYHTYFASAGEVLLHNCAVNANNANNQRPTLDVSRSQMPDIANNIENAINNGQPSTLTRMEGRSNIRQNRRDALRGQQRPPSGQSLDEYPFASTYEGGAGSNVMPVPASQQSSQGGQLSQFYQQNNINDGDQFDVRVVP